MQTDQSLPEPLQVTLQVTHILEKLQIPYFIGGSLASAVYGTIRATMDVDLVADLRLDNIQLLINNLENDFYIDSQAIINALQHNISFNFIHKETMFKVDIFPLSKRSFEQNQMERRVLQLLGDQSGEKAYFTTAEDIILAKLIWYRLGGEVSERQWRDILGVIQVQEKQLDLNYLRLWAAQLNLTELFERVYQQSQK